MIPGGALIRLAAWYLVLIALILACFNVIVYFTLSQTLQARVAADLEAKSRLVMASLATSDAAVAPPQAVGDTAYGDTFVRVLQTTGKVPTIVLNAPKIDGLFDQDDNAVARAEVGLTTESQDTAGGQLYAIRTDPVKNKKGAVVGALQVARPISWIGDTLTRLERQLALASGVGLILGALVAFLMALKSLRPIQRNLKKQREFVADASHELRTPLTLIRTNAEAWLRRAAGTSQATYAQHILEEVDQLNAIVGDLTTLALADARQLRIERRPVELSGIVRELIDHTAPLAEERHVRLAPELNGGVQVQADAIRMRQLLLILLDNALSYTPEGGEVSVSVARQNGKAKVTVADTGPGISARDLPHIFDRFYRADKARSGGDGHIGLGLPIAKWIVDAHRGDIQVKSTPGVGTRIAVSLPAMEEEPWLLNLP